MMICIVNNTPHHK